MRGHGKSSQAPFFGANMLDAILEVISGVFEAVLGEWYAQQRWWVKAVVWAIGVLIVLAIIYYLILPPILGSGPR
jgi:hypothetical protein